MNFPTKEIEKLCLEKRINFISSNDRYSILAREADRTKTAYCFSIPICNDQTKKLVDLRFHHQGLSSVFIGSNSKITIREAICLQNAVGAVEISLPGAIIKKTEDTLYFKTLNGIAEVTPTLNGLLFKMPSWGCAEPSSINLKVDCVIYGIRSNKKCFAFMSEKFKPLITVSCIGFFNREDAIIAPCEVSYQKINKKGYSLVFTSKATTDGYIAFEINMHELKLIQDTTVESLHPTLNNAFGGTAYLGNTCDFGEQWLYSRIDFSILPQLLDKRILRAVLHLPSLNESNGELIAHKISARFCSFGSNWKNKKVVTSPIHHTVSSNEYYHLDITDLIKGTKEKSYNFVIKAKTKNAEPVIISTGDSYYKPQILEVNFK